MYLFFENFKQKKYIHCSALQIVNASPISFTIFCLLTHVFDHMMNTLQTSYCLILHMCFM